MQLNIIHVELELWQWGLISSFVGLLFYIVTRKRLILWQLSDVARMTLFHFPKKAYLGLLISGICGLKLHFSL